MCVLHARTQDSVSLGIVDALPPEAFCVGSASSFPKCHYAFIPHYGILTCLGKLPTSLCTFCFGCVFLVVLSAEKPCLIFLLCFAIFSLFCFLQVVKHNDG